MSCPEQGEVWQIEYAPEDERPGIIVSRTELNKGRLMLVVPCTGSRVEERTQHRNHLRMEAGTAGFTKPTCAQLHLVQPVDREWLKWKRGKLSDEELGEVLHALAWVLDLYQP